MSTPAETDAPCDHVAGYYTNPHSGATCTDCGLVPEVFTDDVPVKAECIHVPGCDHRAATFTVEQIREAFAKHASPDSWGVPAFYEDTLIAALRGEYDVPPGASA